MMLTCCPNCATTFRVTPEQLKARQGQVRCGNCRQVFDALRTLAEDAVAAQPPTTATDSAWGEIESAPQHEDLHIEPTLDSGFEPVAEPSTEFQPLTESASPEAFDRGPDTQPTPDEPEFEPIPPAEPPAIEFSAEPEIEAMPAPAPDPKPEPVFHAVAEPGPEPEFELHDELPPRQRRWPWILGSVVAFGVLVVQALLYFRVEVVTAAPNTRPGFVAACGIFGCELTLPHKIELIGIESSDLAPDNDKQNKLHLTATLRNRAPYAQAWPHLELTLTDAQERPLLRRSLAPGEYLPATTAIADGFPRRGEQAIQLALQTTDVPAVGYRLYVFYP